MSKLILLTGHISSGKTLYAKALAAKRGYRYLSIDDAYAIINGSGTCRDNKFEAWELLNRQIHTAEYLYQDVIIDVNAPTPDDRNYFLNMFPNFGEYHLLWIDCAPSTCLENNRKRDRIVPEEHMNRMFKFYVFPQKNEDMYARRRWDSMTRVYNDGKHFKIENTHS